MKGNGKEISLTVKLLNPQLKLVNTLHLKLLCGSRVPLLQINLKFFIKKRIFKRSIQLDNYMCLKMENIR